MATEYERPRDRVVERTHTTNAGSGMGIVLGVLVALGIAAIMYFALADRSPTGPSTATSRPPVTAPEGTAPRIVTPPANTTTPTTPSTK